VTMNGLPGDSRLLIVSNRTPYVLRMGKDGRRIEKTIGGMVSALEPVLLTQGGMWMGWGEGEVEREIGSIYIPEEDPRYQVKFIALSQKDVTEFYYGFSNTVLWPLCHYFLGRCRFSTSQWKAYERVNRKFADSVLVELRDHDFTWVHDYHLALVPRLLREQKPRSRVAFFWHIPFPHPDVFRALPWRAEILQGLLGNDLLGFHLESYADNFLDCAAQILKAEVDRTRRLVVYRGRRTAVRAFPVGVDVDYHERIVRQPQTSHRAEKIRRDLHCEVMALGVERLDYTKGILERLWAVERFLELYSEFRRRFVLVQIAVPSRTRVEEYKRLKREIDETVGRINGRFSEVGWTPVRYLYRGIPHEELIAYYLAADLALVTPLRDGLNLAAKEYVAVKENGALILSEFAGAAVELPQALLVNPFNTEEVAQTIHRALHMTDGERRSRIAEMRDRVKTHDIHWWRKSFFEELNRLRQ